MIARRGKSWSRRVGDFARRLRRDEGGLAIAEFAMILPTLLILYIGGFEFAQATSINRKMADLNEISANIFSQAVVEQSGNIDAVNTASVQVMAPFDTTPLTVVAIEVTTDATYTGATAGKGKVVWSRSLRQTASAPCPVPGQTTCNVGADTPYVKTSAMTGLPPGLAPNTSYLLFYAYYNYSLGVGSGWLNPIPMISTQLAYLPRAVAIIPCTDCT